MMLSGMDFGNDSHKAHVQGKSLPPPLSALAPEAIVR